MWKWKVKVKSLSHVRLAATRWTAAYQAPPSMGFCRQEYWSGVPLPSPMWVYSRSLIKMCWFRGQTNELMVVFLVNIYMPCFKIQIFLPLRIPCVTSALSVCVCVGVCVCVCVCVCVWSCFSCIWLFVTLWTVSPPGSSAHGILQARILEWVPCPPPGDLPNPGIEPTSHTSLALAGGFFTTNTIWEALCIIYLLSLLFYILYHNYCLLVKVTE